MSRTYVNFWRLAPCLFAIIVDYMGLGLVYPIVAEMFTEVPDSVFPNVQSATSRDFYMGLAYVLYPLFMFFGASFLGDLSDNFGRKKVLLLTMGGIFFSFILMTWGISIHSISVFLIGRSLSGLMAGSQPLCMAAIADLSTPETKAWSLSLVTLTNCVGLIFGPFVGGVFTESYFIHRFGFSLPFIFAAFCAVFGFFLLLFFFKETFVIHARKQISLTRPITIFIDAFQDKHVSFFVIVVLLQMLGFMLYYQTIGVYLRDLLHYSSATLGYFYGFMGIFFAVGVWFVIPHVLKRFKIPSIAAWGFFFCGFSALISIFYQNEIYIWATVIPFAIANATGFTAMATVFSNSTDERKQGWIMGVLSATVALSYILSGFSTNLLPFLGARGVIAFGGIMGMLSGLLMLKTPKRTHLQ